MFSSVCCVFFSVTSVISVAQNRATEHTEDTEREQQQPLLSIPTDIFFSVTSVISVAENCYASTATTCICPCPVGCSSRLLQVHSPVPVKHSTAILGCVRSR